MFLFCLNTSTIRPAGLLDKIRLAGEHGFGAIELWLDDVESYLAGGGRLEQIAAAVAEAGLVVPCTIALKGWGDAPPEGYARLLDAMRRRMDLAARLGSPYVVATPPPESVPMGQVVERYQDLLALGRQAGVRPAMEYLGFCRSVWRIDQAWQVVLDSGDEAATVVLDSFHTFRGGSSLSDFQAIPAERIANYHLNDAPASPPRDQQCDADRVMPQEGIVDLRGELELLAEKGYEGPISLELFNPTLWRMDPSTVVATGIQRMRALVNQMNH